jgi:hypothetical protein
MRMSPKIFFAALFSFLVLTGATSLFAEEFYCEALSVEGGAYRIDEAGTRTVLKEGDTLKAGDSVETDKDSFVDLSYDKDWKNVQRIEASTKIKLESVYPAKTDLADGSVFVKLKGLPKDSSFDVRTPTAVATVRGTEYRASFVNGQTEVFNSSDSSVFVYGRNEQGAVGDTAVILKRSQKTQVAHLGEAPQPPQAMSGEEVSRGEKIKFAIDKKIEEVQTSGRKANIQDVAALERAPKTMPSEDGPGASHVTDLRRRPFKKVD